MPVGILRTASASWQRQHAPRINVQTPPAVVRAMKAALRAVDLDIERAGAVSEETIDQVRAALALALARQR